MYNTKEKQKIIDFIYTSTNMNKLRYKILEMEDDLQLLLTGKYKISPNFSGISSLLIFMKDKKNKYGILIDRKSLHYDIYKVDPNAVDFYSIIIDIGEDIYKGTIFDGTYMIQPNRKLFIITDCLYFCGKNMNEKDIDTKLLEIKKYLEENYDSNDLENSIELTTNKLTDLKDTEKLILNDIKKVNKTIPIRGVIFYPEYTNMRLLFLFNNELKEKKNQETSKNEISYILNSKDVVKATFEMRRTKIYDVYNLFLIHKNNNEDVYKYVKIDIAYIPTIECSKKYRKLTENGNILVDCDYLPNKNVWLPQEENKMKKYPTDMNELNFIEKIIN